MAGNAGSRRKRAFDVSVSVTGLVLLFPLFSLIGLAIKIAGKGPVLFRQRRIGKNGKPFLLLKFRTMEVSDDAGNGSFDAGDQSRVTPLGRFLRKFKIDELPQMINVLKGEMSLVGPRPEVEKWVAAYPERWRKVLSVMPGITDNASIAFRNEEEFLCRSAEPEKMYRDNVLPLKLTLYEEYVDNHSFSGDLAVLFKTFFCCVFKI